MLRFPGAALVHGRNLHHSRIFCRDALLELFLEQHRVPMRFVCRYPILLSDCASHGR